MCGIAGCYNFQNDRPIDRQLLQAMTASIKHRGPDDDGFYIEDNLGLGMRRLSIIDVVGGHQPIGNEDGSVWIVFNGEIYNFPDLRRELLAKGHLFRTRSDTETVVHAYEEWGTASFAKLNGMFGFALWDSHTRELFLARDPFGVKPLYYAEHDGRLLFGSEIKALLADADIPREVNPAALDEFLTLTFVPSPNTLFAGIKKLPPGHFLRIAPDGSSLQRFYFSHLVHEKKTEAEWLELLKSGVESAIQRQMISDVPVGVMLSGGMDSAVVATLMRRFSGNPVQSFTVGFEGDFDQNELAAARRSAEIIGTEHHEIVVSSSQYAEFLPLSLWHLEEPIATTSALAFYWICRLASRHVKVVLTGQGADEPFAGYGRHFGEYYGGWYRQIPYFLRRHLFTSVVDLLPRNEQLKRAVHSLDITDPLARMTQVYTIFDFNLKKRLYRNGLADATQSDVCQSAALWQNDARELDGFSQMLYVDARFSLPDNLLMYGDKMAMAASLEARVPFLDLELMALVESMPPQMKIRGRVQKYLLKRAAPAWIPREIIRRKKIGFATPMDQWFGGELRNYIGDQLLATDSACRQYFEPATIESMIVAHEKRHNDYKRHLFSLLTFELWHKRFIREFAPIF